MFKVKSNLIDNAKEISPENLSSILLQAAEALLESDNDKALGQRIQDTLKKKVV